jgi:AraC-like DNA-binding protein
MLIGPRAAIVPIQASKAEIVRFLIDRHHTHSLSVNSIARQVQMSRSALFRCFREAYQVSPKDYLDSIRMEHARRLLRQRRFSIKEIAAACGYANGQYFSRAFKRHCGVAPGQWRADS